MGPGDRPVKQDDSRLPDSLEGEVQLPESHERVRYPLNRMFELYVSLREVRHDGGDVFEPEGNGRGC